jgi:two-component system sensor histidine kinase RegB
LLALGLLMLWFYRSESVALPWRPLAATVGGMALINFAILIRLTRDRPVSAGEFFFNLLLDIAFLTALLYLTGGSTNPLVSYYLVPLIISAAVLRPAHTWFIAILTMACYTLLLYRYVPLDLFAATGQTHTHTVAVTGGMNPHFIGMWVNFAFTAVLIAWFVVRMAATMREQQAAIASARESGLVNERIISVASIAASAAHELRTPLATMTVLADEMRSANPEHEDELELLQQQIERCDEILHEMVATAGDSARREVRKVREVIARVVGQWNVVRPEVHLEAVIDRLALNLGIAVDQSFHYALLNFLHNAADASPEDVRLSASKDGNDVLIVIEDRGPGIPPEIEEALGRHYISRKEGGLGLGVLLSSASIERLNGDVALLPRRQGGTRLEIRLPSC